ncbi:MAG: glycosyltransferase family 1 protein [Candidatus Promineifilaceae bacterium]|nr:glycosyltransferase family 1 protein [Candidatus Promineifilaceae bacterium]
MGTDSLTDVRPTIGVDATAALMQGAGIGRYTRELIRALVSLHGESGFSPFYRLFSARPPATMPVPDALPLEQDDAVSFHPAPLGERWLYRLWHRLRVPLPVQVFTGKVDLFHEPDFVLPPVVGNVPTLLTVHDLSFIHYPETFTPALVNYLGHSVPRSVARATHIVAVSENTRRDLVELWNVPPERISVVYNGVDDHFQPVRDDAQLLAVRRRYGLGDAPYLLSVGTIQPRKNYRMLIRAFRPIAQQYPHDLVIGGGKGWLYEEVIAEAARQKLEQRVHFIGYVANAHLPALYSGATLFALPSLYEGFGLPLLEAMACGVATVASSISSLPEVAGEASLLLPPRDQQAWTEGLKRLLQSEQERRQLAEAGLRRAMAFSWEASARQLVELYRTLLP